MTANGTPGWKVFTYAIASIAMLALLALASNVADAIAEGKRIDQRQDDTLAVIRVERYGAKIEYGYMLERMDSINARLGRIERAVRVR